MKVGIISSNEFEINTIKNELERVITKDVADTTFIAGVLDSINIVIVNCNVGKISGAMVAQAMIDHFDIDCIINTGIAFTNKNTDYCISKEFLFNDLEYEDNIILPEILLEVLNKFCSENVTLESFVTNDKIILKDDFVYDLESGAVAKVSTANNIPVCSFKYIYKDQFSKYNDIDFSKINLENFVQLLKEIIKEINIL